MLSKQKRKTPEDENQTQSRPEKRRMPLNANKWKLWMVANYLCVNEAVTFSSDVIEHSREEEAAKPLDPKSMGYLIKDVFGSDVKLVHRGARENKRSAYLNLKRIDRDINNFQLPKNWIYVRDRPESLSVIRHEQWEFNNVRVTTELCVTGIQNDADMMCLQAKSHGCMVDLKNDIGLGNAIFDELPVEEQLSLAAQFVDKSSLCLGCPIEDSLDVIGMLPHVDGNFKFLTSEQEKEERRSFSAKCEIFATQGSRCADCTHFGKVDAVRRSRKEGKGNATIHPYCNKRFLTKEDLQMQLALEQRARRNAEKRERYWKEKFLEECADMELDDHQDLSVMFTEVKEGTLPKETRCLWEQQRKILGTASKCGYRWHPKIIKLCLDLYCKNPHVLDPLRQFLRLPSNRTIRHYKNKHDDKPGWNRDIVDWCLKEAQAKNLQECDFWGGLIFDEMKIEENVEMVVKNGKHRLVGFVELGRLHDDMQRIEGKPEAQLASHVLQFVCLSDCGFRFPIAQFPSHNCTPSDLFSHFWKGVLMMKEFGFTIYWCILDGAECNRKFIQMHFPNQDPVEKKFSAFNIYTGGPMVFIVDCKHNFKKIRNNLEKSNRFGKPRCLTVCGKQILWSQLVNAYQFDQTKTSVHLHEKLTEHHFKLDPAQKMRNHLAEEVLDKRMHYLMVVYRRHLIETGRDGNSLNATIELLDHTSKLIEFFSTSRVAVCSKDDVRIKTLDTFFLFLKSWKEETSNPKQFLSCKLWFDIQSMIHGFKSILNIKLTRFPQSVLKAWIVNQDVVENNFCQVRACNGQNNNPTYKLQESTQNSIRYGQNTISSKSNAGVLCKF